MGTATLLLGSEGLAAEHLVRAAGLLEIPLHLATTRELYACDGDRLRGRLSGVVFTDFGAVENTVDALAAYCLREGIGAVAVSTDSLALVAALLCDRMGLPGHDPATAVVASNRWLTAQAFRRAEVPGPVTLAGDSPRTVAGHLRSAELTGPFLVRPADTSQAADASVVASAEGLPGAVRRALAAPRTPPHEGRDLPAVVVQEYLEGTGCTVVSVLRGGRQHHAAVVRRISAGRPVREEIGRTVPAGLGASAEATIRRVVSRGLRATGLRDGIAHTDVVVTPDGPKIVRVGAGPPDGPTIEIIEHATGVDVAVAYLQAVLGRTPDDRADRDEAASVRFISTARHGVFHELTGITLSPHMAALRSYAEPGDLVGDTRVTYTRLGHLVVVADTPSQADAYADQAVGTVSSLIKA